MTDDTLIIYSTKWKPWFAWYPVMLHSGKKVWFKKIYKRSIIGVNGTGFIVKFEYADLFDLLKSRSGIFEI